MGTLGLNSALDEDQRRAGDSIIKVCSAKPSGRAAGGGGGEMTPEPDFKINKSMIFSRWSIFWKRVNEPPDIKGQECKKRENFLQELNIKKHYQNKMLEQNRYIYTPQNDGNTKKSAKCSF